MKALVLKGVNNLELKEVPDPDAPAPHHLLVKVHSSGINSGDKLFISGAFPRGIPASKYDIAGVSGAGTVIETGQHVPGYYKDSRVIFYRSLKYSEETIGTWSEYAHLHYLNCAVLPPAASEADYSGSLVNIITAYAFLKQARQDGHDALICTAGNSSTGIAMLGLCIMQNFPVISIVRTEDGKRELEQLGASHVLVQADNDFKQQLQQLAEQFNANIVFDGVGGSTLSNIINVIPFNSLIYSYGFLDKETPFSFHTTTLMKGITIKGFSNFRTATVQDPANLEAALRDISHFIGKPFFRTKIGGRFGLDHAEEALRFYSPAGGKAIFMM